MTEYKKKPERVKRSFAVFTINKEAEHPAQKWRSIATVSSHKKLEEQIKYLESIGVEDMRVSLTTTHTLLDTIKGIDKITNWESKRYDNNDF